MKLYLKSISLVSVETNLVIHGKMFHSYNNSCCMNETSSQQVPRSTPFILDCNCSLLTLGIISTSVLPPGVKITKKNILKNTSDLGVFLLCACLFCVFLTWWQNRHDYSLLKPLLLHCLLASIEMC